MRVIKFRAWQTNVGDYDKITKKFTPKPHYFYGENVIINGNGQLLSVESGWDIQGVEEPTDYVLEQYTGFKDKNGKEIWGGDIVYCSVSNGFSWGTESFMSEVCIDETGVRFKQVSRRGFLEKRITQEIVDEKLDTFEVMGNIHDNPELLKEHISE